MTRTPENNRELFSDEEFERRANKLLDAWTGDIRFALDRLERLNASDPTGKFTVRLDMTRVGVFGHSFWRSASRSILLGRLKMQGSHRY